MPQRRSVALLLETSNAYSRGLLDGIIAYQREHELWSVYLGEQERGAKPPVWLKNWEGDGIIARIETDTIAQAVRHCRLPAVDVSAARLVPELPWVETDDEAIAQAAVEHFVSRGFSQLAFCGEARFNWSRWREKAFLHFAHQQGCECYLYPALKSRTNSSGSRERFRLTKWIEQLPKPVAIMACYDFKGQQILDVCRELEIAVPEEVAVLGVDYDQQLCRLCTPPLSSIIPDTRRAGYEAARLLDSLMRGRENQVDKMMIPPQGIAERQSSDIYAVDDPELVLALRYIREHACEGINVSDVLKQVPLSRRMLESRCQRVLGRTPHSEITRIKLERTRRLLSETNLTLSEIADRTGFAHAEYLSAAFKKMTGVSPRTYRNQYGID